MVDSQSSKIDFRLVGVVTISCIRSKFKMRSNWLTPSQQYCETSLSYSGKKLSYYIGPDSAVFEVLEKIRKNASAVVKFDVPINWKNKGNQVFDMYAVVLKRV